MTYGKCFWKEQRAAPSCTQLCFYDPEHSQQWIKLSIVYYGLSVWASFGEVNSTSSVQASLHKADEVQLYFRNMPFFPGEFYSYSWKEMRIFQDKWDYTGAFRCLPKTNHWTVLEIGQTFIWKKFVHVLRTWFFNKEVLQVLSNQIKITLGWKSTTLRKRLMFKSLDKRN